MTAPATYHQQNGSVAPQPTASLDSRQPTSAQRAAALLSGGAATTSTTAAPPKGATARAKTVAYHAPTGAGARPSYPSRAGRPKLVFPSSEQALGQCGPSSGSTRTFVIPQSFSSPAVYRQAMCGALYDQLNVQLFEVGECYHRTLQNLDLTRFDHSRSRSAGERGRSGPSCVHGVAKMAAVKKEGRNKGRLFYACPNPKAKSCGFFKWVDEMSRGDGATGSGFRGLAVSTPAELEQVAITKGVQLYAGCSLATKQFNGSRWARGRDQASSKKLFLTLNRREHSSQYGKDDIWILSRSEFFPPGETFAARSTFFGPNNSNEVELQRVAGGGAGPNSGGPSGWYAIHAFNASSELAAMDNIEENLVPHKVPLLPYLMHGKRPAQGGFVPQASGGNKVFLPLEEGLDLAQEYIGRYHLNEHQADVLLAATRWVSGRLGCRERLTFIPLVCRTRGPRAHHTVGRRTGRHAWMPGALDVQIALGQQPPRCPGSWCVWKWEVVPCRRPCRLPQRTVRQG